MRKINFEHLLFLVFTGLMQSVSANVTVVLDGIEPELQKELLGILSLERHRSNDRLTDAGIKSLYSRAPGELREKLRSLGYYNPVIIHELESVDGGWLADFNVSAGDPVIIGTVDIQIISGPERDQPLLEAAGSFPLQGGEQLDHAGYLLGKRKIENLAKHRGYFDAHWKVSELAIDTEKNSAQINLVYAAGERYRYGEINIPDTVINKTLLARIVTIDSGNYYDAGELVKNQQKLQNTDYFAGVDVRPESPRVNSKTVDITVQLQQKEKNSYRAGFGFGTDTGPRLVGAWDNNYFNDRGHRIETDLRISPVLSSLSSAYLIPFLWNTDTELGLSASVSHEDTDSVISDKFQTGVQHLKSRWGWNETVSLTYQYEDYKVADISDTSHLLIAGLSYWKSVTDDPLYTREGYRLSGDIKGAAEGVISDVSFLQLLLRGKYITSPIIDGRIIVRVEAGATLPSSFTDLPSSFRFFAGGDNSIRGFDFDALGPVNDDGEVIGGKYLLTGSLEYEHRIYGKWSAALFSDFGNAFRNFTEPVEYSIGGGIRWQSPVGLIRVDLASGISSHDNPVRLHIIVGPDL